MKKSYKEIRKKFPQCSRGEIRAYIAHVTIGTYEHGRKLPATNNQKSIILKLSKKGYNSRQILNSCSMDLRPQQVAGIIANSKRK